MQGVFLIAACASVLAVALICIFLFANGIPAMREIGCIKFITGEIWRPNSEQFGILPMIVGSLYVTAGAIIFGVPIGILTSVFMAMYCPKQIYKPLKAATELLAGIPSVIYGFFGLVVVVPLIRDFGTALYRAGIVSKPGNGNSILTASLILGMMILPTIIGTTESANQARLTGSILDGIRTLTGNIVIEMGYATGLHREALIATGVVLFVFILIINLSVALLKRGADHE